MKRRRLLLVWGVLFVLLQCMPVPGGSARAAPVFTKPDSSLPVSYIIHPCMESMLTPPILGPQVAFCRSPVNTIASIGLPLPTLVDRVPDHSLVSIPTYVSAGWDESSLRVSDSEGRDIAWPVGNPTNRLENVRLQLRLRVMNMPEKEGNRAIGQMGLWALEPRLVRLFAVTGEGEWGLTGEDVDLACNPGITGGEGADPQVNTLFMVPWLWGGFNTAIEPPPERESENQIDTPIQSPEPDGDPCRFLQRHLQKAVDLSPPDMLGVMDRYLDIQESPVTLREQAFVVWTPHAIQVELSLRTRSILDARMIWTDHQVKKVKRSWDCAWEYRDRYDRLDWSRWPDPIYCREEVREIWVSICRPEAENCEAARYGMGDSETWWQPVAVLEGEGARMMDGSYAPVFTFPVYEVAAYLTAP